MPTNPLSQLPPAMVASLLLLTQQRHVLPQGFYMPIPSAWIKYLRSVTQVGVHAYVTDPSVKTASVQSVGLLETEQRRPVT